MTRVAKSAIVAIVLASLGGCATVSTAPNADPVHRDTVERMWMPDLGELRVGHHISVAGTPRNEPRQLVVGDEYFSASGKRCRRLAAMDDDAVHHVACHVSGRGWYLARPLTPERESLQVPAGSSAGRDTSRNDRALLAPG